MTDHTTTTPRDGSTDGSVVDELDAAERHYLLSDPARRAVLAVMAENASSMTLGDLASEIATAGTIANVDVDGDLRDLEVALHHNHLPRLANARLLEYDSSTNSVQPRTEQHSVLG
jgi:hypothetical protein